MHQKFQFQIFNFIFGKEAKTKLQVELEEVRKRADEAVKQAQASQKNLQFYQDTLDARDKLENMVTEMDVLS